MSAGRAVGARSAEGYGGRALFAVDVIQVREVDVLALGTPACAFDGVGREVAFAGSAVRQCRTGLTLDSAGDAGVVAVLEVLVLASAAGFVVSRDESAVRITGAVFITGRWAESL